MNDTFEKFALPLLVIHGSEDALTDPEGSRQLVERASSGDKQLKVYDGLYHEVLNEPEKDEVLAEIAHWLDNHVESRRAPAATTEKAG
jgi:alpha-beta hydrolase superfamily lysophospholipase